MASIIKEAIEEKKAADDDDTDDELEQDDWDAEEEEKAGSKKKKKSAEAKKKEQEKTKNRKEDTAKITAGGDFQIQVHIIEGRDLKGKDSGGTSDPVVTINIFDEKQSTKIKSKTKNPRWDQVLYFELSGLEADELSRGKALIQVFDADIITRNDIIGVFEFDLAWIYYKKHHEVYNQWIALTNMDDEEEEEDEEQKGDEGMEGIEGYLKLSITILAAGDEQYIHDEEEELAKESKLESGMILISPGIEQTPYLLTIKIYEARNLCKTDDDTLISKMMKRSGSKNLDPFFYVEYAGVRLRSKKYVGVHPKSQVEFRIPIMEPVFSKDIVINVMDYDKLSRNDRIACLKINYIALKKDYNMRMEPCWQYLFGAPRGYQNGYGRKMNKGLVEGSNFRGKLFMEATVQECKKKQRKKVIEQINALQDHETPVMVEYYLRCDLYEGTEINKIDGLEHHMFVQVEITHNVAVSQAKKINDKNSSVKWFEALVSSGNVDKCIGPFLLPEGWNENPQPVALPDVFIYLCVKEFGTGDIEQVSYCRIPLNKIIPGASRKGAVFKAGKKRMWENTPTWYDMKENLALDKYSDNVFPGALLIGLNAGPKSDISKVANEGKLVSPPALSRPFSHALLFKAVPTDQTPEPPSPVSSDVSWTEEEENKMQGQSQTAQMVSPKVYKRPSRKKKTHANVTIQCIEAVSLPAMDRGNQSDPYVEIIIEDENGKKHEKECEPFKKNLNPKWNQDLHFDNVKVGDILRLRVMDWDFGFDKDDEMGYIQALTLTGADFEGWLELKPSKNVVKKYRKKQYLIENMKIKIGIKYEWDDLDLDEDEREKKKKKKKTFLGISLPSKKKQKEVSIDHLSEPERRPMQLRIHCYQARNLENADISGLSDGYLVVRFCGASKKTKVIEDHVDPKWYESLYLGVNVPIPLQYAPRIYCEIYDHDQVSKDQSLGRFSVSPEHVWKEFTDENENKINDDDETSDGNAPRPQWYKLENAEQTAVSGEILCAFELIDVQQSNFARPVINPPCKMTKRWLHCITLGLRDIQSILGCHKPFMEFEMNGNVYKTEKSNRPDSRNPNFCQILKFEVMLPQKNIFLPNLNLTMKDSLFGGLIKRKLGFASVEVEDLITADAAEQFKLTEDEIEQRNIRNRGVQQLEEFKDKSEEKVEYLSKEPVEDVHEAAQMISFSTDDSHAENQPLIKDYGTSQPSKSANDFKIDMIRESMEQGHFAAYEYTQKESYDLSKTLPDYMQGRALFDDELEDKMSLRPFLQIPFFSGKAPVRTVGFFKGLISFTKHKKDRDPNSNFKYLKEITKPTDLYLRLYILRGMKLIPRDLNGLSDPYLVIKIGKTKINTRNDYIGNTLEPGFYQSFELPIVMPGVCKVDIEVWDWDGIGDDLIGKTRLDIEDRWYTKEWRDLPLKPVETRTLWSDQSTVSQGKLSMWMELISPGEAKKYPMVDITPPPRDGYELRVVVWQCKDCPIMDSTTNMNDLYITGGLITIEKEEESLQQTDLHFRSQNGCGSFNWRMKFPIGLPKEKLAQYPNFQIQIWDKDFFSPNDNISEAIIPLQPFLRYCEKYSADKRCVLTLNGEERFWIDLKEKGGGKIQLSFELLPNRIAKQLPAGFGRDDPNNNPHLPEPEGRAKFSFLHPCDALRNLLGDRLCCKIIMIFCCLVCIALLIFITPNLISAITANLVTGG